MKVVFRKGWVKIQQMYENLEFDLNLKLLFMATGAYCESGLCGCQTRKKETGCQSAPAINIVM